MTDLNDWRLEYLGNTLDFGTKASGYPFQTQVTISEVAATNQDMPHPNSDGIVMGLDRLGGFSLTMTLTTLPAYPAPAKPWDAALDTYGAFYQRWRADSLRRLPGQYANLINLDRGRMVIGRPRKIGQSNLRLRKGELRYVAQFDTIDPNWYSSVEKFNIITPNPPAGGGFTTPLTPPFSSAGSGAELAPMTNDGNVETWPVISFHGPAKAAGLELLTPGGAIVWSIKIPDKIAYDEVLTIDTRPWRRGASIAGKYAGGRLRGTALDRVFIPPGSFNFRYRVTDRSGNSFAEVRWRDAYVSM